MNIKQKILALGALLLGVGFFGASPAFAAEGYIAAINLGGTGVMCEPRVGGTLWPVNGTTGANSKFYYCGTSTAANRGFSVYNPLKGISNVEPSIGTLMTTNTVRVYVFDSPLQYAQASGQNPVTVWNAQVSKPAFSLFTALGDPENAIIVYENVPDTAAGYPAVKPQPTTLQNHDSRHETGHHFDRYNGMLSNSATFNNLYPDDQAWEAANNPQTVADNAAFAYWWGNKEELFAEQFAIATGSVARNPLDSDTTNYFKCTYRFTNNWYMNQANPGAGTYATQCTP